MLICLLFLFFFIIYYKIIPERRTEPFSELAVLDSEMKIENYPKNVMINEDLTLHLYISNHEGQLKNYLILVKLGNQSSFIDKSLYMEAPILYQY